MVASCVPSKPTYEEEVLPADRLIKKLEANRRKVKTFQGSGILNIKTPKMEAKASFEVYLKKPDSIKFSIYGPFGIDLAEAVVSNTEFIFYDAIRNKVYKGRTDKNLLKKIFHINLSFSELIDAFAGAVNLTDKLRLKPDNYVLKDDSYMLSYIDSTSSKESIFEIQISNLAIKKYKLYAGKGNLLFEGNYSKFRMYNRVAIPYSTIVENKNQKQKINIDYRNISVNEELPDLTLEIPTDAQVIEW
jgi:outer membrane lipoprotein-sorting protein